MMLMPSIFHDDVFDDFFDFSAPAYSGSELRYKRDGERL